MRRASAKYDSDCRRVWCANRCRGTCDYPLLQAALTGVSSRAVSMGDNPTLPKRVLLRSTHAKREVQEATHAYLLSLYRGMLHRGAVLGPGSSCRANFARRFTPETVRARGIESVTGLVANGEWHDLTLSRKVVDGRAMSGRLRCSSRALTMPSRHLRQRCIPIADLGHNRPLRLLSNSMKRTWLKLSRERVIRKERG